MGRCALLGMEGFAVTVEIRLHPTLSYFILYKAGVLKAVHCLRRRHFAINFSLCFEGKGMIATAG